MRRAYEELLRSEVARALGVSQPTARDCVDIAHGACLWRAIPAWTRDSIKRTVKHPRGYVRDSGLLHALLRIPDLDALLSHPQMGCSWEGMVVEEILRQLNSHGIAHEFSYYRTGGGAEVDLVLEGNFGLIAIEIKHASTLPERDLRSLRDFVTNHRARLGVVISNDVAPRLLDDRLVGLPFAFLLADQAGKFQGRKETTQHRCFLLDRAGLTFQRTAVNVLR